MVTADWVLFIAILLEEELPSRKEQHLEGFSSENKNKNAVAGERTRVTRVTGGNTHHYTTTTLLIFVSVFKIFN